MSIPENAPQWLKDAKTENANVRIESWGSVTWLSGVWHSGVWRDGDWLSGDWRGGVWLSGDWRGGDWRDGDWLSGDWRGGVWRDGDWHSGVWRDGDWLSGVWHSGDWRGGVWRDGDWLSGVWRGGKTGIKSKWSIVYEGEKVKIGCKEKTFKEWDRWFKSKESFETPRTEKIFGMIHAHYQAVKTYSKFLKKNEKKS